jgi:hypothetical protein
MCVDRIAVCVLCLCGNIYTYRLHVWLMYYVYMYEYLMYTSDMRSE